MADPSPSRRARTEKNAEVSRDVPVALGRSNRLIAASTVAAWICLALILAGFTVGSVPVRSPKVQDCGAPLAFVLGGRVDTFVDPNNPPRGVTPKQAEAANERPCRKRVAPRAVRSGELLLAGLVVGLAGLTLLVIGRVGRRRTLLRAGAPAGAPSATWGLAPMSPGSVRGDGDTHERDHLDPPHDREDA